MRRPKILGGPGREREQPTEAGTPERAAAVRRHRGQVKQADADCRKFEEGRCGCCGM